MDWFTKTKIFNLIKFDQIWSNLIKFDQILYSQKVLKLSWIGSKQLVKKIKSVSPKCLAKGFFPKSSPVIPNNYLDKRYIPHELEMTPLNKLQVNSLWVLLSRTKCIVLGLLSIWGLKQNSLGFKANPFPATTFWQGCFNPTYNPSTCNTSLSCFVLPLFGKV